VHMRLRARGPSPIVHALGPLRKRNGTQPDVYTPLSAVPGSCLGGKGLDVAPIKAPADATAEANARQLAPAGEPAHLLVPDPEGCADLRHRHPHIPQLVCVPAVWCVAAAGLPPVRVGQSGTSDQQSCDCTVDLSQSASG